jgi:hypothetical protein
MFKKMRFVKYNPRNREYQGFLLNFIQKRALFSPTPVSTRCSQLISGKTAFQKMRCHPPDWQL